jgi:hypothetical protein
MATEKQTQAARKNVEKAHSAAKSKRTIANLPTPGRSKMGKWELIDAIRGSR